VKQLPKIGCQFFGLGAAFNVKSCSDIVAVGCNFEVGVFTDNQRDKVVIGKSQQHKFIRFGKQSQQGVAGFVEDYGIYLDNVFGRDALYDNFFGSAVVEAEFNIGGFGF
jgi:hypothetical protein